MEKQFVAAEWNLLLMGFIWKAYFTNKYGCLGWNLLLISMERRGFPAEWVAMCHASFLLGAGEWASQGGKDPAAMWNQMGMPPSTGSCSSL